MYRLIKPPDGSELKLPERAILESRYSYMQDLMQNMGLISNPTRPKTNEANKPFAEQGFCLIPSLMDTDYVV